MEEVKTSECRTVGGKVKKVVEAAVGRYVDFIFVHPLLVILVTGFVASLMTFLGIYFHYDAFTFNPRAGFETRGTPLAKQRMALVNLMERLAHSKDLRPEQRVKREARLLTTTEEPFTINYDDYGGDDFQPDMSKMDVCMQYAALGASSQLPYDYTMVLSKVIWRIDS
uniref:Patched family protein n=1 Tax=Steinernema glaseri TaxID=37863 RepID=A0A1I8AK94_9BILA